MVITVKSDNFGLTEKFEEKGTRVADWQQRGVHGHKEFVLQGAHKATKELARVSFEGAWKDRFRADVWG